MKVLKYMVVLGGVGLGLLAGCATPPEPFEYHQSNELKPGPGIFTGKEGVYTIYGTPPAGLDETDSSAGEAPDEPDDQEAQ